MMTWRCKGHRAESLGCRCYIVSAQTASSGPGELCVNGLLPVLRTVGLRHRRHPGGVGDRGVHRPLAGTHVAKVGVHVWALASCMAVVGVGTTLVVWIVILRSGDGGVRVGAVVLQVEGPVGDMLRGALLLAVVAGAQLLCLNLGGSLLTLLALLSSSTQSGQRVLLLLLLLGHPGVGSNTGWLADWGTVDGVAAGIANLCCTIHPSMAVRRQVLIKLVNIEASHVGDDIAAQLTNVHSSKIDVELATTALLHGPPLTLQVSFAGGKVCLRGGRGCWRTLWLT